MSLIFVHAGSLGSYKAQYNICILTVHDYIYMMMGCHDFYRSLHVEFPLGILSMPVHPSQRSIGAFIHTRLPEGFLLSFRSITDTSVFNKSRHLNTSPLEGVCFTFTLLRSYLLANLLPII